MVQPIGRLPSPSDHHLSCWPPPLDKSLVPASVRKIKYSWLWEWRTWILYGTQNTLKLTAIFYSDTESSVHRRLISLIRSVMQLVQYQIDIFWEVAANQTLQQYKSGESCDLFNTKLIFLWEVAADQKWWLVWKLWYYQSNTFNQRHTNLINTATIKSSTKFPQSSDVSFLYKLGLLFDLFNTKLKILQDVAADQKWQLVWMLQYFQQNMSWLQSKAPLTYIINNMLVSTFKSDDSQKFSVIS